MKILVTGGCGFLGSNLVAHYLRQGAEVIVVDALLRLGGEQNRNWLRGLANSEKQLTLYHFDIAENSALEQVFLKHGPFDYICHVAGQVAMTTSLTDPRRDMLTNVVGTFNVLENTRAYSPNALVAYSSTNKVYGDLADIKYEEKDTRYIASDYPMGFDELLRLDFASPYGCSKGSADQYVRDWHRNYGLKTVVFRHSSIYGGLQHASFDQGWIGWFCKKAVEQKTQNPASPFTIAGTGKQVRDVLHATDIVNLYDKAFQNREIMNGEIFNIGGGLKNSLSLIELFEILSKMECNSVPLNYTKLERRKSDQDFFVADIRKAKNVLGWEPLVSVTEGLLMMLDWTKRGR